MLAQQRARFLRHVRSYWEVVRHRVAPEVGELLDGLQALGQLKVRAARLLRAGLRVNSADALIRERGKEHNQVEQYDYVIRATGLDTDILCTTHPLASHLREAGLISADTQGLGVNVTDDLEVLISMGIAFPVCTASDPCFAGICGRPPPCPSCAQRRRHFHNGCAQASRLQRMSVPVPWSASWFCRGGSDTYSVA